MKDSLYYLIDENIIKNNLLKKKEDNKTSIIDGRYRFYELGNDLVRVVNDLEIDYVLVDNINEALELRKYNEQINIIVKNMDYDYIFDAIMNNIIFTVYSSDDILEISKLKIKDDYKVFLYIFDELKGFSSLKFLDNISDKHLKIVGAYTEMPNLKKHNQKVYDFYNITKALKEKIKFIISDDFVSDGVIFFSKSDYLDDYNKIMSLNCLACLKKISKNEIFLGKKNKKDRLFGYIKVPFQINVKKVYKNQKYYKVRYFYNGHLIIELKNHRKNNSEFEILGGNSKNDITNFLNVNEIPRYYHHGNNREIAKF